MNYKLVKTLFSMLLALFILIGAANNNSIFANDDRYNSSITDNADNETVTNDEDTVFANENITSENLDYDADKEEFEDSKEIGSSEAILEELENNELTNKDNSSEETNYITDEAGISGEEPQVEEELNSIVESLPEEAVPYSLMDSEENIDDFLKYARTADGLAESVKISSTGVDGLTVDNGIYLYNLVKESAQSFDLTFPESIFQNNRDKGDIFVTIKLPKYGMAFDDNIVNDLNTATQIKSASFVKDGNGYNTTLNFVIDAQTNQKYLTAFSTKYVTLTNTQCEEIISNGWEESPVEITIKNGQGDVISTDSNYMMKPGNYNDPNILIPEHVNTTTSIANYANSGVHDNIYGNNSLGGGQDNLYLNVPTVSNDNSELLRIDEIKFYVPDERFELAGITTTPAYWSMYTGPQAPANYQLTNYFSTDNVRHNDHDGKGSYYVFKPKKPFYNNSNYDYLEHTIYGSRILWKINSDLEPDTTYTASDTEIIATKAGGDKISIVNKGSVVTTLKQTLNDTFIWRPVTDYKLNGNTTVAKYVPGGTYFKAHFVRMQNYDVFSNNTEYKTINGKPTEEYNFPYEIRPTAWQPYNHGASSSNKAVVESITYTVTKEDGTTQEFTEILNKPVASNYSVNLDFSGNLSGNDRVSKVKINWSEIHARHWVQSGFDYTVTTTHEDNSPILNGDLLHIGYTSSTEENGKSFASTVYQPDKYIYLSYGELLCPWLDAYGTSYQMYNVKALDDTEVVLVPELFLKVNSGTGKNYSENPVIDLKIKLNNVTEGYGGSAISDGTFMLSGNMTMTKNMSDWKFDYTVIDKNTKATRTASYQVGTLTGDTELTRDMLGLSDAESFLSLSMSYNGKFVFKDTIKYEQKSSHADNSSAGMYDLTYLLKNIKAYTTSKSLNDKDLVTFSRAYREGSTMYFNSQYNHSDSCPNNKANFFYGENVWNYPAYIISSSKVYTINGPNFSANVQPTVIQSNTFTASVDFNLKAYANTDYMNSSYQTMPYDVPEQVFIELVDNDFILDKTNAEFKQSLQEHGMTEDDVEEIEIAGKKWIKLNIKNSKDKTKTLKNNSISLATSTTLKNHFVIALNAWEGATVGLHHPFKDVYFNNSELLNKYDGSETGEYVKEQFDGAVEDRYNLLGDNDNTTKRLWYGDMSNYTVEVLRNGITGMKLYPVKDGNVHKNNTVNFFEEERDKLSAQLNIKMAEKDVYNYTAIIKIPSRDEVIDYDYIDVDNILKTGKKQSDLTLYLTGPAAIKKNSLKNSNVTFEYSKDGVDFVDGNTINPDDFKDYRYVKTTVDIFEKYQALNIELPLESELKTDLKERKAYVGGVYSFDSSNSEPKNTSEGNLIYAEYVYKNYLLNGKLFWDNDENGINDIDDPAKGTTLHLYSPDSDISDKYGNVIKPNTLIGTVKTKEDGQFSFSSYIGQDKQFIKIVLDNGVKLTKQKTGTGIFDNTDDSDFDRETNKLILPKLSMNGNENISGGLTKLPLLTVENIVMHVKDTSKLKTKSESENPNNLNPVITYDVTSGNEDISVITAIDVTGNAIGIQKVKASTSNTLGDIIEKEFEIKIYANVIYDANGSSGYVPVDNALYTSTDDNVIVKENNSLYKQGYAFVGWSLDKDAANPDYLPNEVFKFMETEKNVILYAIFKPIPPTMVNNTPKNVQHSVPVTSDVENIWIYLMAMGLSALMLMNIFRKNSIN
ncbi:MAG: InlB B-repeat-containing protein [Erysipelotrichaceae bacterium]|nr:InlB B-repeat-containing protein [Erysipelotrichaceae bacterium]